jgi:hypothetical protein
MKRAISVHTQGFNELFGNKYLLLILGELVLLLLLTFLKSK